MTECAPSTNTLEKSRMLACSGAALVLIGLLAQEAPENIRKLLHATAHYTALAEDDTVDANLINQYQTVPFFDIRREGLRAVLEKKHITQIPPLLLALERFRNEQPDVVIREGTPAPAEYTAVRTFITWCRDQQFEEAADAAESILTTEEENNEHRERVNQSNRVRMPDGKYLIMI